MRFSSTVRPVSLLILALALAQGAWFLVRSRLAGAPFDEPLFFVLAATGATGIGLASLSPDAIRNTLGRMLEGRGGKADLVALAALTLVVECLLAIAQPHLKWDEWFVRNVARVVAKDGVGELFAIYLKDPYLGPKHPPLGTILFGYTIWLTGSETIAMRVVAAICSAATVATSAWIARSLFGDRFSMRTGLFLLSFPLFVRIGAAAMNDILVTCSGTLVVAFALRLARDPGRGSGWALGLALGTGILIKYTAVLLVPVAVVVASGGRFGERRRALLQAMVVCAAIVLAWLLVAWDIGVLGRQTTWVRYMAHTSTYSMLGRWSASEAMLTKFPSAIGLYNLPLAALGVLELAKHRGRAALVVVAWIGLISVPLLLTLPDNRYFLPAFPALAIVVALGLERLAGERDRLTLLSLLLCWITLVYYATLSTTQPAYLLERL